MNADYLYSNQYTARFKGIVENCCITPLGKCVEVNDGCILPQKFIGGSCGKPYGVGGVIDFNGNIVQESVNDAFGAAYDVPEGDIVRSEDTVIYLGYSISHWGTFLVDLSKRLYYKYLCDAGCKIAFCGVNFSAGALSAPDSKYGLFFSLAGIDPADVLDIRTPTRFKKIYVPTEAFTIGETIAREYLLPFEAIVRSAGKDDSCYESGNDCVNKIYLTRQRLHPRKESGERAFERFFEKNGYKVVAPESLNFDEQVRLFAGCKVLASIEGTGAHNILFAPAGSKQIIIRRMPFMSQRQPLFNLVKENDVTYIDCYARPFNIPPMDTDDGPYLVLFNKNIKKYAKDSQMKPLRFSFFYNSVAVMDYLWHSFWFRFKEWGHNIKSVFVRRK